MTCSYGSYSLSFSLPCSLLRRCNPASHDADVFAVAPGGDGFYPGDSLTVAQHFHAVDGFDNGGIVAQQNVAEPVGVVGGQLELGGDVDVSGVIVGHTGFSVFGLGKRGTYLAVPMKVKQDARS
jgi:hypothetical protein